MDDFSLRLFITFVKLWPKLVRNKEGMLITYTTTQSMTSRWSRRYQGRTGISHPVPKVYNDDRPRFRFIVDVTNIMRPGYPPSQNALHPSNPRIHHVASCLKPSQNSSLEKPTYSQYLNPTMHLSRIALHCARKIAVLTKGAVAHHYTVLLKPDQHGLHSPEKSCW